MQDTTPGQKMGREDPNANSHNKQVQGSSAENLEQISGLGSRNPSDIDVSQSTQSACPLPLVFLHPDAARLISLKPETELNRVHPCFSTTALLAQGAICAFL